jgi:hypothetical protein
MSALPTPDSPNAFDQPCASITLVLLGQYCGELRWTTSGGKQMIVRDLPPRWVKELLVLEAMRRFDKRSGNPNAGFMADDEIARHYVGVGNQGRGVPVPNPKTMSTYRTQLAQRVRQECARYKIAPLELFEQQLLRGVRLREELRVVDERRRREPPPLPFPPPAPGEGGLTGQV